MEKPIDFWLRKGKVVGETKPTEKSREQFKKSTIRTKAARIQATSQKFPIFKIRRYLVGVLSVYRQVRVSYASRTQQLSAKSDDY